MKYVKINICLQVIQVLKIYDDNMDNKRIFDKKESIIIDLGSEYSYPAG